MKPLKRWFGIALALCGLVAGGLFIAADWEPVTEPEIPQLMVQGPVYEVDWDDSDDWDGDGWDKDDFEDFDADDGDDDDDDDDWDDGAQGDGYTWSG